MASRKSSRSTTVRRDNLLRSVTEVRTGRMTTNGLFRLGSQTMTEVNRRTGRVHKNSYFIVRNDLRVLLAELAKLPLIGNNVISTFYNGSVGKTNFRVRVPAPDTVSIGCKTFTGKAATALREWANRD